MNRRRLGIVVVLAALFGAALPYLEWTVQFALPDRISPKPDFTLIDPNLTGTRFGPAYIDRRHQYLASELLVITWGIRDTPESWANLAAQTRGLATEETVTSGFGLHLIGVPFRGMYLRKGFYRQSIYTDSTFINSPNLGAIDAYLPPIWPTGILWAGFLANIASSLLFFTTLYTIPQYFLARRRIKRGKCWRCGYLSHGAAVCPECGVGVKA